MTIQNALSLLTFYSAIQFSCRHCHQCGSQKIRIHGHTDKLRKRYRCMTCKITFVLPHETTRK